MLNVEFTGAQVLGAQTLETRPLAVAQGLITDVAQPASVDLCGYIIMPGIVDVHGDGFERHLAPRRGAMKTMYEGLVAAEAELAANGITTAVLAQFISWEGGLRGYEFADQVFGAIQSVSDTLVTDLRGQLRLETHLLDLFADLPERMAGWGLSYIVFNDHLPHDRLAKGQVPKRMVGQALKAGRNPDDHLRMMQDLHAQSADVPGALDWLCKVLAGRGIQMGSHDDTTAEGRAAWRKRGVSVAEFPETLEAAEAAAAGGDHVVLGSPNVVRGGSHNGNVSALELISMGIGGALASDYHYPSPRRAAFMLADSGVLSLAQAWHLVSGGPAAVLGLSDRGEIATGKRADLLVLDAQTRRVAMTMAGGRVSYMSGDIAARFLR
ncbi:MAG: alpha-D-ribose 1-methylphosphonate 5-triphosphate diphosphatase [Sulfitobacter litoralis]|uniref:Alpha-D-ribose 1-methylphosphonate 5-triphosphate diphosphatase n=1 Tax=Sulfitobacter litoralis TaxID=335975 RepID=A0ABY0RRI1_9RHOB|nr:alpha-D-ribose 1-methylphosphonate 5-triphosphate diphosphatase [Sulfitobacter litoralis]MBQ0716890.1 alpha-D-ribose 1-methylphosphonate 5-triphosphate diphosphatase [Sulfitobacter litoralis]MBQ0801835.1 alpha-D-ribose 1-methylphosphonate 5-triphosphate diphosphatase [Sulfitobacter litoralis]SDO39706.1 alpha-D-ribose 1-methylphosphonate 5-triphosphate diphosphatase [Sulfitobacter litoralis]